MMAKTMKMQKMKPRAMAHLAAMDNDRIESSMVVFLFHKATKKQKGNPCGFPFLSLTRMS